ncbi:MAG: hypothetical protein ABIH63_00495 [archaeon]
MIVKIDYKIGKPYFERLAEIERVVNLEIERRKKVVDLDTYINEKADSIVHGSVVNDHVCYSCLRPIYLEEDEVTFIEPSPKGRGGHTYLHLSCVKQRFKYLLVF